MEVEGIWSEYVENMAWSLCKITKKLYEILSCDGTVKDKMDGTGIHVYTTHLFKSFDPIYIYALFTVFIYTKVRCYTEAKLIKMWKNGNKNWKCSAKQHIFP